MKGAAKMSELTEKERQVLEYITDTIRREGFSPSVRDIGEALKIKSTSTVQSYIKRLEEKGVLKRESGKSRTLRIDTYQRDSQRTVKVPILGKVAAGKPILAIENQEGYVDFPMPGVSRGYKDLFALRVAGESMINAGILSGDIVVVRRENYAENGDIVVALVEDEATVKRFYKENGHFRLQPENPTMEPIIVDEVFILGRVVAVLRYYQ